MYKVNKFFFALWMLFLFSGFSEPVKVVELIRLEPYKSLQNYEHFKRLVLTSDEKEIDYIEGFNFEWGYAYVLKIEVTKIPNRFSDGTNAHYKLDKIITKIPALTNSPFNLVVDPNRYYTQEEELNLTLAPLNDSTYRYFEEITIVVPELLSNEFKEVIHTKKPKMGQFEFVNHQKIKLLNFLK